MMISLIAHQYAACPLWLMSTESHSIMHSPRRLQNASGQVKTQLGTHWFLVWYAV